MSAALPQNPDGNCCLAPCDEQVIVNLPGPEGEDGDPGAAGTAGQNAFTTTSANFTAPAELGSVTIDVVNSDWAALQQIIFIQSAGYYLVTAIPSSTELTIKNLEDTATGAYPDNAAPATIISSGVKVCPGGKQGPAGTGSGDLISTNNLSDVANAATARANLGLTIGTNVQAYDADLTTYAGITPSANVQSVLGAANYAAIRTLLALVPGTDVQAFDAFLLSIAALGTAADRMIYTTGVNTAAEAVITAAGRALLDDLTAAAQRNTLEVLPGYGLLASQDALDLNSGATDTAITINATRYLIDKITLENPSAAVTTATLGLFTAAGGGGTTLAANQALSGTLTATTKIMHLAKQAIVDTDLRTDGTLYLRVGTAEGAARTVNAKVYGWKFA